MQMEKRDEIWSVQEGETPEEYVERVGGLDGSNVYAILQVESHFGYDRGQSRILFLNSRSLWESFFLDHTKGIFERGGSRYGALRFIQRKNEPLRNGKGIFSEQEINALIDSVGNWHR